MCCTKMDADCCLKVKSISKYFNTVPIHNKRIFVRPERCAYYEKSAYLGKKCLFWEEEDFAS